MKMYAKSLEEKITTKPITPSISVDSDAEAAMKRYTEKLKKENEKFRRKKHAEC